MYSHRERMRSARWRQRPACSSGGMAFFWAIRRATRLKYSSHLLSYSCACRIAMCFVQIEDDESMEMDLYRRAPRPYSIKDSVQSEQARAQLLLSCKVPPLCCIPFHAAFDSQLYRVPTALANKLNDHLEASPRFPVSTFYLQLW